MNRSINQLFGLAVFIAFAAAWYWVHERFGQTAGLRVWGIALLVVSVVFTIKESIPLSVGATELEPLTGWRKSFVLLPTYLIGLLVAVFPHSSACAVSLKGYVC